LHVFSTNQVKLVARKPKIANNMGQREPKIGKWAQVNSGRVCGFTFHSQRPVVLVGRVGLLLFMCSIGSCHCNRPSIQSRTINAHRMGHLFSDNTARPVAVPSVVRRAFLESVTVAAAGIDRVRLGALK
jgi:hypothetical protein